MVIDCFPFFNELDLLEIRLHELKDVVDVTVLTESPFTFTGKGKPLFFEDNKQRFAEFNIVYSVFTPDSALSPAAYEKAQKQYNIDCALEMMEPGDVMILGDADEIPRASVVEAALKDEWQAAGLVMTLFYYYMNCRSAIKKKRRDARLIRPNGRFEYNSKQNDKMDKLYYDAGWHFSFLGDIKYKLAAYNHAPEYDKPPFNEPKHIDACKELGLDLLGRRGKRRMRFEFTDDISYLPQYVLDNKDKFSKHIKL